MAVDVFVVIPILSWLDGIASHAGPTHVSAMILADLGQFILYLLCAALPAVAVLALSDQRTTFVGLSYGILSSMGMGVIQCVIVLATGSAAAAAAWAVVGETLNNLIGPVPVTVAAVVTVLIGVWSAYNVVEAARSGIAASFRIVTTHLRGNVLGWFVPGLVVFLLAVGWMQMMPIRPGWPSQLSLVWGFLLFAWIAAGHAEFPDGQALSESL